MPASSRHHPPPQPPQHLHDQPAEDVYDDDPNDDNDILPLSNQDVEVLYTIVTTAQRLQYGATHHLPPYRALFTAYDRVLADRRIDPNQDRVYFRFLLRMRGVADAGTQDGANTLYEKFEALLADMGIQLEVDEAGDGGVVEDVTRRFDDLAVEDEEGEDGAATPGLPPLSRRASFDDTTVHHRSRAWGDEDGKIAPRGRWPSAKGALRGRRASSRASDNAAFRQRRPSSRASDTAAFRHRRTSSGHAGARPAMHSGFPNRGRLNWRNGAAHSRQSSFQSHGRARSLSSQGSLRITRTEEIQRPAREPGFYDVDDFSTLPSRRSSISGPTPERQHHVPPEMLYRPSPTQMLADADTFLYARTLFRARRCLQTWHDKAMEMKEREAKLEAAADFFNKKKRGEAALEALSVTLKARNAAKETEKFYESLYQRVAYTRKQCQTWDLFTRWFDATARAIERTKIARYRVIMRTAFNAWYEQSAVEELKVRRFTMKRHLNTWRRKVRERQADQVAARALYVKNRVHSSLVSCFWAFCERRAAKLYDERLKARTFANMLDALAEIVEREELVQEKRELDLKGALFHFLANKMLNVQTMEPTADDFRRRQLLARTFGEIKLQAKLQPLERQLHQKILQSRGREILSLWQVRTEQAIIASEIDRKRVLHNAFVAWNDNMRCSAMRERIDNRIVFENMMKWLLEARCSLFVRVRKTRTKQRLFKAWLNKVEDQHTRLSRMERTVTAWRDERAKRKALDLLKDALDEERQREAQALAVYEPRVVNRIWPQLVSRHERIQQLEQWGADAEFYTVATHALKLWKESTHKSQRMRRRDAYSTIRRRTKLSMARRMFEKWRSRASTIEFMALQAQELQENTVLKIATHQLDKWHDRTASVFELGQTADSFREQKLASRHFGIWLGKFRVVSRNEEKAAAFLEVHVAAEASACLKKLNWRLFQVQRQEQSGIALAERNYEKHCKGMLRHWAEKMHRNRRDRGVEQAPELDEDDGQLVPVGQHFDEHSDATEEREADNEARNVRHEQWTPFDSSALDVGDLKLSLNFDPNVLNRPTLQPRPPFRSGSPDKPNPFAMTIRNPDTVPPNTSTPVPGYLRSPSKRSTIRAAKARERLAALSNTDVRENETRRLHPLSKTVTATSATVPSANASFDSSAAPSGATRSASAAAPSFSNSTFVLNTHTGSTTPLAAPAGFGSYEFPGTAVTRRAADSETIEAPGTAPAAVTSEITAFIPSEDGQEGGGAGTRNFGASTMLAATPGPATNKTAITPFARKLTAQGYSAGLGRGSDSARSRRGRGYGGVGLGLAGFGGFEDIAEDESPRDLSRRGPQGGRKNSRESSP